MFLLARRLHCLLSMTKQVKTSKVEVNSFQVTEQYKGKVLVVYFDILADRKLEPVWITKGLLAKHFHDFRVLGSNKGVWLVSL